MKKHFKSNWYWYTFIFIFAGLSGYFYLNKAWSERNHILALEEAQVACDTKITTVSEQILVEQLKNQSAYLSSLLEDEIAEEKWDEVRQKMNHIVRKTLATEVQFVGHEFEVSASSNERREGKNLKDEHSASFLASDDVVHSQQSETGHLISVPAYHEGQYLGRAIFHFSAQNVNLSPVK